MNILILDCGVDDVEHVVETCLSPLHDVTRETFSAGVSIVPDDHDVMLMIVDSVASGRAHIQYVRCFAEIPIIVMCYQLGDSTSELLDAGADAYCSAFASQEEIFARCNALSRRGRRMRFFGTVVECGDVRVDVKDCEVCVVDQRVDVTQTEYRILVQLLLNRDAIVSKEVLQSCLRDPQKKYSAHLMDVHINNLRRKIGIDHFIESVSCQGVRISAEYDCIATMGS